jgi:hypothetical protein
MEETIGSRVDRCLLPIGCGQDAFAPVIQSADFCLTSKYFAVASAYELGNTLVLVSWLTDRDTASFDTIVFTYVIELCTSDKAS